MNTESKIEAILFHKAESMTIKELSAILELPIGEIENALVLLDKSLSGRGISLLRKENEIMLRTSSEAGSLIEKITKEELSKDLGRAGLETLSIVLYKNPISKRDVEYIRGVTSSFVLRSLLLRGLIERIPDPKDARSYLYKPTFDALGYLGVKSEKELPEYEKTISELESFMKEKDFNEKKQDDKM